MTFRTGINIELMTSKALRGKAPQGWDWGAFYKTFKQQTITPHGFAAHIYNGYSFIPPYKNGRRLEANFTTAYHVAFDFDSGGAGLDHLMRDGGIASNFASFAYSTPSSTPETPKSRVVFIIPDGIDTAQKTRQLYAAIASAFKDEGSITDPSCKDPLRLYYGSYHCEVRGNWSVLFSSAVDDLIASHKPATQQIIQKAYTIDGGTIALSDADSEAASRRIEYELRKVATAPDGQKHFILNRTAYLFGGWVASGYLTEGDATGSLESAIRQNAGVKDIDAAIKTIETAVLKGTERPAIIQSRIKRNITL